MALPIVKTIEQCGEYAWVVEPLLPQLQNLPSALGEVFTGKESLLNFYINTNPLVSGFVVSVALGFVFLVVSEINKNYSQVDRCWSILPSVYNAHFAIWARLAGLPHQRLDLVLFWSVLWSIRLTFNYWRRGGYSIGSEDYRWEIIRNKIHPVAFHLLNVVFIAFFQSILLFLFTAPTYVILLASQFEVSIQTGDLFFLDMEIGLILVEVFADQQQWNYHAAKTEYKKTAKVPDGYTQADLDRGFVTSSLWGYSRHPNFAAEQTIWLVLYQWSCFASKVPYCWTGIGALILVLLFQGSGWLTESISAGKYPEYKEYQKKVGMFVPASFWPYKGPGSAQPKVLRTSELAKKKTKKTLKQN